MTMMTVPLTMPSLSSSPPKIWIEIHDASPGYGIEGLREVLNIIEKHRVDRVVIFVVPNHGNTAPLSRYPDYIEFLKEQEKRGHEIGIHGFTHKGLEFYSSKEATETLLNSSRLELNFTDADIFLPPRFAVSQDSLKVLREEFDEVYLLTGIIRKNETLPYMYHEFTWFPALSRISLILAKVSYMTTRQKVFRLAVHINRVDDPSGLKFLDDFLTWTDSKWS